ncbi:F-box domain-containing protein [Mycena indigotica]|uniref:F-box domain-containing protein n=1 Tax=Mycena indigotica TaxID=2126181 RepID=A0A8H6WGQ1_9AGAR|nr:F-box domain-containing protein [Mycena indigotica]KAF7316111.1 F-box domain-containing protein [Mycena indigotica]
MSALHSLLLATIIAWSTKVVISRILAVRAAIRSLNAPYGGLLVFNPFYSLALIAGRMRYPREQNIGSWQSKFTPYARQRSTCVGAVILEDAIPIVWFSDAEAIKYITSESVMFQKDSAAYKPLNFYGMNLVGTEGADWRRHRRISNPAFNETGNAFVWKEAIRVANEWFAQIDSRMQGNQPLVINAREELLQAALLVISSAGFGRRASWAEDGPVPPGHTLAFRQAVSSAVEHLHAKVMTPDWFYALSGRVYVPLVGKVARDTRIAFEAVRVHMQELVGLARAWVIEGKVESNNEAALLRNLVEANMNAPETDDGEMGTKTLAEDELLSNTWASNNQRFYWLAMVCFGGIWNVLLVVNFYSHIYLETTGHTMTFAVGLLALYPDVQQKLYEEAVKLWPNGAPTNVTESPYKETVPKLSYTIAVIHETLRLFPAVIRLLKLVREDAIIPSYHFDLSASGTPENLQHITVPVQAGSQVMVDIRGLHHNPMYWPEPEEFRPERFIDTESYRWPRDAFLAFSAGPRNCIGQRFALTEGACILASLVRNFRLAVPERLRGLSVAEQRESLLAWRPWITMQPFNCSVELSRRKI